MQLRIRYNIIRLSLPCGLLGCSYFARVWQHRGDVSLALTKRHTGTNPDTNKLLIANLWFGNSLSSSRALVHIPMVAQTFKNPTTGMEYERSRQYSWQSIIAVFKHRQTRWTLHFKWPHVPLRGPSGHDGNERSGRRCYPDDDNRNVGKYCSLRNSTSKTHPTPCLL
jgi:hypothetical protein